MLAIDHLTRRYGATVALDDLSFHVAEGEVVGFLGPNGAGKTTAMRAVFGIVHPDAGDVRWRGKAIDHPTRQRFGYMPEERGLYPTMRVHDLLVYLARLHGMSKADAVRSSDDLLERFGLGERRRDRVDALSMGNQQRVQLAAALVHTPDLLVLDEPFSGLDPGGIESMGALLQQRARDGAAVVFSSHQLDLVEELCDRVVIIHQGHTVAAGTLDELTSAESRLVVKVDEDPAGQWAMQLEGAHVDGVDRGRVRISLDSDATSQVVLDAARAAGTVRQFSFERERLSEVFRRVVQR